MSPRDKEIAQELEPLLLPLTKIINREKRRAWYLLNADKAKANSARYRKVHPDRVKEQRASWASQNPHHHRDWSRIKRARVKQQTNERSEDAVR